MFEWKYTGVGLAFLPTERTIIFKAIWILPALTTLFLLTVVDVLVPRMTWGVRVPVCFTSCLMFVVLISAHLSLPKESVSDSELDHVICLHGIFPFSSSG